MRHSLRASRKIVVAILTLAAGAAASGQSARGARAVHGVVLDASGAPVGAAEIRLLVDGSTADSTHTAVDGRFALSTTTMGASQVYVRRMGYRPQTIPFALSDVADSMKIVMEQYAMPLEEKEILAESPMASDWLRGFNERKARNGFGHFLTRDSIVKRRVLHASDLLRRYPSARVILLRDGRFIVRMRNCTLAPLLWVDGVRVPQAEIDDIAQADDIAGMEVYPSMAGVPAQFMDRSNGGCGTIVIWTRTR